MGTTTYLIGIGSNMRTRWGAPGALVGDREQSLLSSRAFPSVGSVRENGDCPVRSRVYTTAPVGPGTRRYANSVALIETDLSPPDLLAQLKSIERAHGRRAGQRWGDRPLDLDIIGWSGGIWSSPGLAIPHPAFRERRFVLAPLCEIAPGWRDPVTRLTARQLLARLDRKRRRA